MTTDYRDLITRMANELDEYRRLLLDDCTVTHRLSNEARAALGEADEPAVLEGREPAAVTKQPSDEEIIAFWSDHCAGDGDAGIIRLARWGTSNLTQTWLSPADGEVAECAAELLQRQALPEVGE